MINQVKKIRFYALILAVALMVFSCSTQRDVSQYAATEVFASDTILQAMETKRAMIVIAHDDDMCGMAGTISLLNKQGWEIAVLSFSQSPERN